jgi:membrane-associated protease RseP (regulator of RpoE activity)
MRLTLDPFRLLLISLGGCLNQHQREVIDYLAEENRVLREQLGSKRLRILEGDTVDTFEGEIQKLIVELKISHMVFFHHCLLQIPPNYAIGATFQPHGANGNNYWMFQDVQEGGPAHLSGMHAADLLLEVEGKPVEPPNQPTFRMGGSCDVIIEKLTGERVSQPLGIPRPKSKWHPIIRPRLVSWFKPEPGIGL